MPEKKYNDDFQEAQPFAEDGSGFDSQEFDNLKENKKQVIYSSNMSPKFIFGVLLVFGAGILIFGFTSLYKNIYQEVSYGPQQEENVEQGSLVDDLLILQNQDTDKDGLSDYDEEYVYKTSPYLLDTDSDGYSDKDEIDGGYDPLCPKGEDCYGVQEESDILVGDQTAEGSTQNIEEIPQEVRDQLKLLSADEVRSLMLESGQLTQEQLDAIDDDTLMQIFNEVLQTTNN